MSDLRTSFLKSRLGKLPAVPPFPSEQDELNDEADEAEEARDTFSDDSKTVLTGPCSIRSDQGSNSSSSQSSLFGPPARRRNRGKSDFSPLTAEDYFEQALEVEVELGGDAGSATFRVYYTPPRPRSDTTKTSVPKTSTNAAMGGYAGVGGFQEVSLDLESVVPPSLPDDEDDDEQRQDGDGGGTNSNDNPGTLFVFHHGAGFSALSYALTAREITQMTNGEAGVLAYDCRGHGKTQISGVVEMSLSSLADDLVRLLSTMFADREKSTIPSLVLVGHSMGGSVVVSAAHSLISSGFTRISGVVVLDVVEGTAIDALEGMRTIVLNQPVGFHSIEQAIQWHVDSKTIQNLDSARISVPPLLVPNVPSNSTGQNDDSVTLDDQEEPLEILQEVFPTANQSNRSPSSFEYRWKADLLATEPFWRGWFQGLSLRFLSVKTARLLLLAGTDRLDKELMIGQMQGKYQLQVISDVGHCLHEDAPAKTAQILVDFWKRNEQIKLPFKVIKKVGQQ